MAEITTVENTVINALVEAIANRVAVLIKGELSHATARRIEPALLSVKQAAVYIGRSEQAVQHLIFQRELPVVRVGRRVHLDRRDLDHWIENNKV